MEGEPPASHAIRSDGASPSRNHAGRRAGRQPVSGLDRARALAPAPPSEPRRAAISGFGFGGINCHVLIEEYDPKLANETGTLVKQPRAGRSSERGTKTGGPVAIVGLSACFGPFHDKTSFAERVLGYEREITPSPPRNWWGIRDSPWSQGQGGNSSQFHGYYLDSLEFALDRFRIPPKELGEMLPQQSLMLKVAADAIADARWDERQALRTGVLIGIGLDLNTTNFHLRWSMAENARAWTNSLGLELNADELTSWTDDLKRASGPALTANKTMGSLGGLIASRIAREFKIGGPSFTVSCDETSGIQALAIAADWLRRGELDAVIVGAVDFAGDARTVFARHQLDAAATNPANNIAAAKKSRDQCAATACDGAVALLSNVSRTRSATATRFTRSSATWRPAAKTDMNK